MRFWPRRRLAPRRISASRHSRSATSRCRCEPIWASYAADLVYRFAGGRRPGASTAATDWRADHRGAMARRYRPARRARARADWCGRSAQALARGARMTLIAPMAEARSINWQRKTRAEELRLQLADEIVRGALLPGAALDEITLADRFRVSRTPVREAIRSLAASGLVEVRAHRAAWSRSQAWTSSSACSKRWPNLRRYVPVSPQSEC